MSRLKRNSSQHLSDFDKGQIVAYQDCIPQFSTINWCFEESLKATLKNNTIRCKKIATTALDHCCYIFMLTMGIRSNLFLPDKGPCFVFLTQSNCCEFLAAYGVIFQSDIQSFQDCSSSYCSNTACIG